MKYEKKRYIMVYCEMKDDLKELEREIKARIKDLFGAINLQSMDLRLIEMETSFFAIRCNHKHVDELLFTLSSMNFKGFSLLPLRVSGTIKKIKEVMADFVQI
ncbi:MAG: Rpp14/Pop5 family protein, partial [Nitrososphaerales archaeon]